MHNEIRYPRSSARPIYLTAIVLGMLGLAGLLIMLVAMADVPRQSYMLLIAAFGLLIIALAGSLAVLLATNTRRPWGVDPNFGPPSRMYGADEATMLRASSEGRMRHAVQLPDGKGYGRRQDDDPVVVNRLVTTLDPEEHPLPLPLSRPEWANEMLPPQYKEKPPVEPPRLSPAPSEMPLAEPARENEPPFTEVPLDQLDLVPAPPETENSREKHANGGR